MNPLYPKVQQWFYSPQVFNEQAYFQYLENQRQVYEQNQSEEVRKAVHAFDDLFNALHNIDAAHQQQLWNGCMGVLIKHGITWGMR